MPKVIINRRLKTMAGYAYFLPNELHLCEELLSQYKKEFAEQIIPHEVCHFVCWHRWQDTKHSPAWKGAMSANGYAPERLHYLVNHKHEERKLARMAGL